MSPLVAGQANSAYRPIMLCRGTADIMAVPNAMTATKPARFRQMHVGMAQTDIRPDTSRDGRPEPPATSRTRRRSYIPRSARTFISA